jgi:hypothetical protein
MNQSHAATTIPTDHVSAYRPADTDWFRQALALTAAWPTSVEAGGIDRDVLTTDREDGQFQLPLEPD